MSLWRWCEATLQAEWTRINSSSAIRGFAKIRDGLVLPSVRERNIHEWSPHTCLRHQRRLLPRCIDGHSRERGKSFAWHGLTRLPHRAISHAGSRRSELRKGHHSVPALTIHFQRTGAVEACRAHSQTDAATKREAGSLRRRFSLVVAHVATRASLRLDVSFSCANKLTRPLWQMLPLRTASVPIDLRPTARSGQPDEPAILGLTSHPTSLLHSPRTRLPHPLGETPSSLGSQSERPGLRQAVRQGQATSRGRRVCAPRPRRRGATTQRSASCPVGRRALRNALPKYGRQPVGLIGNERLTETGLQDESTDQRFPVWRRDRPPINFPMFPQHPSTHARR